MVFDYDPLNPPEEPRRFAGRLIRSVFLTPDDIPPELEDRVRAYYEASDYHGPVWYLEAELLDLQWEDGVPLTRSEIIKLQDKSGRWLGKGQVPNLLAQAYADLGFVVRPGAENMPNHAVGKVFMFEERTLTLGGGFTRTVRLYPVGALPDDYEPEDVRYLSRGSPANPAAAEPTTEDAVRILARLLDGKAAVTSEVSRAVLTAPETAHIISVDGRDITTLVTTHEGGIPALVALLKQKGVIDLETGPGGYPRIVARV